MLRGLSKHRSHRVHPIQQTIDSKAAVVKEKKVTLALWLFSSPAKRSRSLFCFTFWPPSIPVGRWVFAARSIFFLAFFCNLLPPDPPALSFHPSHSSRLLSPPPPSYPPIGDQNGQHHCELTSCFGSHPPARAVRSTRATEGLQLLTTLDFSSCCHPRLLLYHPSFSMVS